MKLELESSCETPIKEVSFIFISSTLCFSLSIYQFSEFYKIKDGLVIVSVSFKTMMCSWGCLTCIQISRKEILVKVKEGKNP